MGTPIYEHAGITLWQGDCRDVLAGLPDASVQTCVTSPPYFGLRDYGVAGQIGLEPSPAEYVATMVSVFREVRRVMRDDGTCWLNLGDSFFAHNGTRGNLAPAPDNKWPGASVHTARMSPDCGLKPKDLIGVPWRVAFALQEDGWWLRSDIIWHKPNPMPESVTDRPTRSHEYIFLLTKAARYFYDGDAIAEQPAASSLKRIAQPNFANQTGGPKDYRNGINPNRSMRQTLENFAANPGRNKRDVWTVATAPYPNAHFATFPEALIRPCILAGCPAGGVVLDPFCGAGTTLLVAKNLNRRALGIELSPDYCRLIVDRLRQDVLPLEMVYANGHDHP